MNPLVSILIPSYNAEKWVAGTIESAINQKWSPKEIIVVDDGSRDNTYLIAKGFECKNIKIIRQENRGASCARNRALELAQGDYIQWLDSDDILGADKLSTQLKEAERGTGTRVLLSSPFAEFHYELRRAKFHPTVLWRNLSPKEWLISKFANNVWMTGPSWLVSRRLTEMAGPWDERLTLDDDGEYFCRVVAASEGIRFVEGAKSYYRQWNSNSLSRAGSEEACRSLVLSLSLCIGYLRELEDSDKTREACVKYLQTWYRYFYPEKVELVQKMNNMAEALGGKLSPPHLNRKYKIVKGLFGWVAAREAQRMVAAAKLRAILSWYRFTWELSMREKRFREEKE